MSVSPPLSSLLECSICYERLDNTTITLVPCGHDYHNKCADLFMKYKQKCPECRSEITQKINAYRIRKIVEIEEITLCAQAVDETFNSIQPSPKVLEIQQPSFPLKLIRIQALNIISQLQQLNFQIQDQEYIFLGSDRSQVSTKFQHFQKVHELKEEYKSNKNQFFECVESWQLLEKIMNGWVVILNSEKGNNDCALNEGTSTPNKARLEKFCLTNNHKNILRLELFNKEYKKFYKILNQIIETLNRKYDAILRDGHYIHKELLNICGAIDFEVLRKVRACNFFNYQLWETYCVQKN
ncbi:MAG: RING finger domain-containing protein [Chlamydiota bacterium]|nr:RING finger domain-containing protein [Chlamydiota bacterium]